MTRAIRSNIAEQWGIPDGVDYTSGAYKGGALTGMVAGTVAAGVLTAPIGGVGAAVAAGAYAGAAAGYVVPAVLANRKASPKEILVSAAIGAVTAGVLSSYGSYLAASSGELVGPYAGTIAATGAKIAPPCANAAETASVAEAGGPTRVFWSGGSTARTAAEKRALENGGTTLEMTPAGRAVTSATQDMPWSQAKPLWDQASAEFAHGASGTVEVFHNAEGVSLKASGATPSTAPSSGMVLA